MKNALLSLVFLTSSLFCQNSLRADATPGQQEVNEKILKSYHRNLAVKDNSQELCDAVMRSPRAKARMCEMLLRDPDARKMLNLK